MIGLSLAVAVAACGDSEQPSPTPRPSHRPTPTPAPPVPTDAPAPVIVQVENSVQGRPQAGLSAATAVYEYLAEGGISRFSVIFAQPPPVRVGPVRSARLATIELLRIYQGVLVFSGASSYILGQLSHSGLRTFQEGSAAGDLFRVRSRVPPHNLYTDGPHLADLLQRAGSPRVPLSPPVVSAVPPAASRPATGVMVPVSLSEQPSFAWNPALNGYIRHESTGPFIDENTGAPVVISTLIVQQVDIRVAPEVRDVNGELGVRHTLVGRGACQIFRGGVEYDATWVQPPVGPTQFISTNGAPILAAPGLTWVSLVGTGTAARVS